MKKFLIQDDVSLVKDRIKQFEQNTGCELLLIVADSSDPYPAASWRFSVLGTFVTGLVFSYYLEFHHAYLWPLFFILLSFLFAWMGRFPKIKRLALSDWEVDRETHEKAIECFHTMGTSKVKHKVTVMIYVSMLEKKIILIVDEELKLKLPQNDLDQQILLMQSHFKQGNMGLGFIGSIEDLERKILEKFSGKVSETPPSELKDSIFFI